MIVGKKVVLRLYEDEDEVEERCDAYNQLSERAITDHTEIISKRNVLARFRDNGLWSKDEGHMLITSLKGDLIGEVIFKRQTDFELAIGYRLFKQSHRRKGYMSEALTMFSRYLFETLPTITRLSLLTAEDNEASRKLAEMCAYVHEGTLRQAYFYRGKMVNWVLYSLIREDIDWSN